MTYTDKQKKQKLDLENSQETLTYAEQILFAALGDLAEADKTGDNIPGCEKAVEQAQKVVDNKKVTEPEQDKLANEVEPGGLNVRRLQGANAEK